MSIGTPSIVVVFAIFCLVIFSLLSRSLATDELKLAEKTAQATKDYYNAESRAFERVNGLKALVSNEAELLRFAESQGIAAYEDEGVLHLSFTEEIDQSRVLSVALSLLSGELSVDTWQVVNTGAWEPDFGVDIWLG